VSAGYFDAVQAAKLVGVNPATIRTWVHRGLLPAGRYSAGVLRWTKAQLVSARQQANGGSVSLSPALASVVDARCGCGSQVRVEAGAAGYTMLTCVNCGVTMAVERASEYVYRDRVDALDVAPTTDPGSVLASRVAVLTARAAKGTPLVYFIRLGPYVKVGTSVDVLARIGALSLAPGNLLAVIPGSYDVERVTHHTYARLRAFREWFYFQDELKAHVIDLQRLAVEEFTEPGVAA
jgi:hypothetical protein